jgi:putative NADH-flavin reductase
LIARQEEPFSVPTNKAYNRASILAILGANGRVGGAAAQYATSVALPFRALIRRANPDFAEAVLVPDARDLDAVAAGLDGVKALIVSLAGETIAASATAIVAAAERVGVERVVVVAAAGVLPSSTGGFRSDSPQYPERFRAIGQWHKAAYLSYSASSLDWLVVCPPTIVPHLTGERMVAEESLPAGSGEVDLGQLGQTLVDEAVQPQHHRCRLGIATRAA